MSGPSSTSPRPAGPRGRGQHAHGRDPPDARGVRDLGSDSISGNPRYSPLVRADPGDAGRTSTSRSTGSSRWRPGRTPSPPRPPAPACSSTCRPTRTPSPPTGTPPRCWRGSRSPWGRTRPTSVAASCGGSPRSPCSPRRRTPGRWSSRRRASGRGCGSASASSPTCSTSSRRTSATSRPCCPSCPTRTPGGAGRRRDAAAARAAAAQRDRVEVEPPRLRRRGRTSPHQAGEPGAALGAQRGRRHGQRRVLLRRLRALAEMDRPVWSQLSFSAAEENFLQAAQLGLDAMQYWPGLGEVPVAELCCAGSCRWPTSPWWPWGVDVEVADRLLSVIERRCVTGRNGARWQVETVQRYERGGCGPARGAAADDAGLRGPHEPQRPGPHLARGLKGAGRSDGRGTGAARAAVGGVPAGAG